MNAAAGSAVPLTPSKKRLDPVRPRIDDLNTKYNLGIRQPDETLSPSAKRQLSLRDQNHEEIINKLRYVQTQPEKLERILRQFEGEARTRCRKWVRKDYADPDLLPASQEPPRATTPTEQSELRSALLALLKAALPARGGRIFERTQSGPPLRPDEPPSSRLRSKRQSDEGDHSVSSKRLRGRNDGFKHVDNAIDGVPVNPKAGGQAPSILQDKSRETGPTPAPFFESNNTSRVSIQSNVFSAPQEDDAPPQNTQTTVEVSSEDGDEERLTIVKADRSSQSSYPVSSSQLNALSTSFTHVEAEIQNKTLSFQTLVLQDAQAGTRAVWPLDEDVPDPAELLDLDNEEETEQPPTLLSNRLCDIWPKFPLWLNFAPFAVAWEATRIALHCRVDLTQVELAYTPEWQKQAGLRKALALHPSFQGKSLPELSSAEAWNSALGQPKSFDQDVVFSGSLDFNKSMSGPLYRLKLHPIKLDRPSRLNRHFGSHRFIELLVPSHTSFHGSIPNILKDNEQAAKEVCQWLTRQRHPLAGRKWASFFVRDGGYRKPAQDVRLGPEPAQAPISKERVYLFAEEGIGLAQYMPVSSMLNWLLQLDKNKEQPYLKLFSRVALGLSRTSPALVFEPHEIRHRKRDLRSPTGNVMNDGIGRMSLSVARKVRDALGFTDLPCAIQGRLGSAKGMWIIDVNDNGDSDWIETYPSQRKWICDFSHEDHRTLEVRGHASELKPARLNLQLLPVLENQARGPGARAKMQKAIGEVLTADLARDLDTQKEAFRHPLKFREWVAENSSFRHERILRHGVEFLGGLPLREEETLAFLVAGGHDPTKQKFLQEIAWKIQEQKCARLRDKLNIRVGRSAYMYMVIDFLGVLEEDEVHIGFSSKFRDDDFNDTMVHGIDVLVARSPAHYVSDIQRVKAVFKPELRILKDVVVFPSKGNTPLADKLSGGDYDGDLAWVCWDERIVDNFVNAEVPQVPDLFARGHMRKIKGSLTDLSRRGLEDGVAEMIERSFAFNMQQSFLGICTNYKERWCYSSRSVQDDKAVLLSTLLSNLVDQGKQGIEFTDKDWARLRKRALGETKPPAEPAYKSTRWAGGEAIHIIDYLKFMIAKPAIDKELSSFHQFLNPKAARGLGALQSPGTSFGGTSMSTGAEYWDADLVKPFRHFKETLADKSATYNEIYQCLISDISAAKAEYDKLVAPGHRNEDGGDDGPGYHEKVSRIYQRWIEIIPRWKSTHASARKFEQSRVIPTLLQGYLENPQFAEWAVIRASATFDLFWKAGSRKFAWQMAGRQLQWIKARMTSGAGTLVMMTPLMYAASKPDPKYTRQFMATLEGEGSTWAADFEEEGFVEEDA